MIRKTATITVTADDVDAARIAFTEAVEGILDGDASGEDASDDSTYSFTVQS